MAYHEHTSGHYKNDHKPGAKRVAGILHPIFSLHQPGFGKAAYDFIDFAAKAGFRVWQILPLNPAGQGGSPYDSCSSSAIDPRWLDCDELANSTEFAAETPVNQRRFGVGANRDCRKRFNRFVIAQHQWLIDYACFVVARKHYQSPWQQWPEDLRTRIPLALRAFKQQFHNEIEAVCFEQFLLDEQWQALRAAANERGLLLFGDMPIFVAADSVDVWANQALFELDAHGYPQRVAGVPPDYFSETGQRWGNPLYRFDVMAQDNFQWWQQRFARQNELYDWVRIDHFRGLAAYWAIDQQAQTAVDGQWIDAPGDDLLAALQQAVGGELPVIAEDLGVITPDVTALKDRFELPGMLIMQFAFEGGLENSYHPQNHTECAVVYTGTHDNNTTLGWWQGLTAEQQQQIRAILTETQAIQAVTPMPDALIESALSSKAAIAIIPSTDWLGLDESARINTPGTVEHNWQWRASADAFSSALAVKIKQQLCAADRC